MNKARLLTAAAFLFFGASASWAQTIKVGVVISQTGPAASLGIPQGKSVKFMPSKIGDYYVDYIVLDDATDATKAVANTRKLITEEKVDVIVGPSITPNALAMVEVVAESKVPMIAMAASVKIVAPMDEKRKWVFKTPQNDVLMAAAISDHMAKAGVKSVGFIGFNDAYGDGWLAEITPALAAKNIQLVATERFARADTSVTGQVLKLMSASPEVILVAGAGTPSALPQKALRERGFKGVIYQTHGVANPDFLRVGREDVEGAILPAGPILVASQLPDTSPVKKMGLEYTAAFESANGPGSINTFGAHLFDAGVLLGAALPVALKTAKPGTPEFRAAIRDALEGLKEVPFTNGVVNMTATDHSGLDARARIMVKIENGGWKLQP